MSLPPLAPPPPPPPAPRLPPRRSAPPTPAPRKGSAPAAPPLAPAQKPPRKSGGGGGGGVPAGSPGPSGSSSWPSCSRRLLLLPRKEPRSRPAQGSRRREPHQAPQGAAGRGALAKTPAHPLARGRAVGGPPGSGESLSGGRAETALRFSLSLPPEAIRVLQRRSLEKQPQPPPPRRGAPGSASPDAAQRPLAGSPAFGGGGGGDWRALLRVSLLNERHRYDDVEYEEEEEEEEEEEGRGGDPLAASSAHEGLVRKCTEWLRGVESAAAQDRANKLDTLPHLSTL